MIFIHNQYTRKPSTCYLLHSHNSSRLLVHTSRSDMFHLMEPMPISQTLCYPVTCSCILTLSSLRRPRTGGRTCTCSHLGCDLSTSASAPMRGAKESTRPERGVGPGSASTTLAMVVAAALASAACAAAPCNVLLACTTISCQCCFWISFSTKVKW